MEAANNYINILTISPDFFLESELRSHGLNKSHLLPESDKKVLFPKDLLNSIGCSISPPNIESRFQYIISLKEYGRLLRDPDLGPDICLRLANEITHNGWLAKLYCAKENWEEVETANGEPQPGLVHNSGHFVYATINFMLGIALKALRSIAGNQIANYLGGLLYKQGPQDKQGPQVRPKKIRFENVHPFYAPFLLTGKAVPKGSELKITLREVRHIHQLKPVIVGTNQLRLEDVKSLTGFQYQLIANCPQLILKGKVTISEIKQMDRNQANSVNQASSLVLNNKIDVKTICGLVSHSSNEISVRLLSLYVAEKIDHDQITTAAKDTRSPLIFLSELILDNQLTVTDALKLGSSHKHCLPTIEKLTEIIKYKQLKLTDEETQDLIKKIHNKKIHLKHLLQLNVLMKADKLDVSQLLQILESSNQDLINHLLNLSDLILEDKLIITNIQNLEEIDIDVYKKIKSLSSLIKKDKITVEWVIDHAFSDQAFPFHLESLSDLINANILDVQAALKDNNTYYLSYFSKLIIAGKINLEAARKYIKTSDQAKFIPYMQDLILANKLTIEDVLQSDLTLKQSLDISRLKDLILADKLTWKDVLEKDRIRATSYAITCVQDLVLANQLTIEDFINDDNDLLSSRCGLYPLIIQDLILAGKMTKQDITRLERRVFYKLQTYGHDLVEKGIVSLKTYESIVLQMDCFDLI